MVRFSQFISLGVCVGAICAGACGTEANNSLNDEADSTDSGTENTDRANVLRSFALNVVVPTFAEFADAAEALEAAVQDLVDTPGEEDATEAARDAWLRASQVWQRAELMQFGPAGSMTGTPGGEDLRDTIYSWPLSNACFVDQETVSEGYRDTDALVARGVNRIGLDAMEFLLFADSTDNRCAPQATINTSGSWAELSASEVEEARAEYALVAAQLLVSDAEELQTRWEDGFSDELSNAGRGSEVFTSQKLAFDAVFTSLNYLDTVVKDMKIGLPAALVAGCSQASCLDRLESQDARVSLAHVRQNIIGFQWMFNGGEPGEDHFGIDDLLKAEDEESLATSIEDALAEALTAANEIEGDSLAEGISASPQKVEDLFDAIRGVTDLLKSQLATTLDLSLLGGQAADND